MRPSRRHLLKYAALLPAAMLPAFSRAAASASAKPPAPASLDDPLADAIARIRPLSEPKRPVEPGDWLQQHEEPGQTYAEFRALKPQRVVDTYGTLRLVPIGPLTPPQKAVVDATRDFLAPFFGLKLVLDAAVPLSRIPADAQRVLYHMGPRQLLTTYLRDTVLMERRKPKDAAVLGITAFDLWPGKGWNFVFGQASLADRVGVWSMARNGDPNDRRAGERARCVLRTVRTAAHETAHMFGIRHCIAYQCCMNGSNSVAERDTQPLEFCAECQPKLWWTLGLDPPGRSRQLEAVARRHGFELLARGFARQTAALETGS